MPPTLNKIVQFLSLILLFVFVTLAPLPVLAIPMPPQDSPAFSEPPNPESSHMDHRVVFGIVFVLLLFLIIEVGYACVGSRMPFTWFVNWFVEINNLICTAAVTLIQRLSSFRLFSFFEKAADSIVDASEVGTSSTRGRSGGTDNLPTISRPAPVHVRRSQGQHQHF
ncbi:hypothetical protein EDB92DRAFT_877601 [Lactarius akahatsu]|uniref:Uncharacterized protein n=1 Tax=Lactarius akahatsu TaxID=416441 RepID=A0AAD4Q730_9AGAM|nr:hypothetical protein EDB92DRAFT_877601 [Lactarius akahatsu]